MNSCICWSQDGTIENAKSDSAEFLTGWDSRCSYFAGSMIKVYLQLLSYAQGVLKKVTFDMTNHYFYSMIITLWLIKKNTYWPVSNSWIKYGRRKEIRGRLVTFLVNRAFVDP